MGRRLRVVDLFCGRKGWSQPFLERGHDVVGLDLDPRFKAELAMDIRVFAQDPLQHLRRIGRNWDRADVVLVSWPCEGFSVSSIGKMWEAIPGVAIPKHPTSRLGLELLHAGMDAMRILDPQLWVGENPTGKMRVVMEAEYGMKPLLHPKATTPDSPSVMYCRYGKSYRKATDLWTNRPDIVKLRDPCTGSSRNGLLLKDGQGYKLLPVGTTIKSVKGIIHVTYPDGAGTVPAPDQVWVMDDMGEPCHEAACRGAKTGIQGIKDPAEKAKIPYELALDVCLAAESLLLNE